MTEIVNIAAVNSLDFTTITSGEDLFNAVNPNQTTATTSDATAALSTAAASSIAASSSIAAASSTSTTSLLGYPTPVVIQPDGYTSGYFLENTTTAVLVMQGFADAAETNPEAGNEQQLAITQFLAACKAAGMTQLIVDLSGNGGGLVLNGFDAFKQLFPSLVPFGASRLRATPLVNYLGAVFSADGVYNNVNSTEYQTQSALDVNDHPFASWKAEDGPYLIYGDNFTAELRYNFSDPVTENGGTFNVSGYLGNSDVAPQLFDSSNIVMLMDGACGSTCAVFAELMKSQGGVRTSKLNYLSILFQRPLIQLQLQ